MAIWSTKERLPGPFKVSSSLDYLYMFSMIKLEYGPYSLDKDTWKLYKIKNPLQFMLSSLNNFRTIKPELEEIKPELDLKPRYFKPHMKELTPGLIIYEWGCGKFEIVINKPIPDLELDWRPLETIPEDYYAF